MTTTERAAMLWWAANYANPYDPPSVGEWPPFEVIVSNFHEWTDSAKERNAWRRLAKRLDVECAEGRPKPSPLSYEVGSGGVVE